MLEGVSYQRLSVGERTINTKKPRAFLCLTVSLSLSLSLTAHYTSMEDGRGGLGKTDGPTEDVQLKREMLENNSRFFSYERGFILVKVFNNDLRGYYN